MPILKHYVSLEGEAPDGRGFSKLIYTGRQRGTAESVRDNLVGAILDFGLPLTVEHDDGVRTISLPLHRKEIKRG